MFSRTMLEQQVGPLGEESVDDVPEENEQVHVALSVCTLSFDTE